MEQLAWKAPLDWTCKLAMPGSFTKLIMAKSWNCNNAFEYAAVLLIPFEQFEQELLKLI